MPQVILSKKGDSAKLDLSKASDKVQRIQVKLTWTQAVDLDLHAFYETKDGKKGHIYFGDKKSPYIQLDQDAGVGNVAGNNEENITVSDLANMKYILFATNIFGASTLLSGLLPFLGGGTSFVQYDGNISIKTNSEHISVPLNAKERGTWAAIALIDNSGAEPRVININKISKTEPQIKECLN